MTDTQTGPAFAREFPHQLYIGGWREGTSERVLETRNPFDNALIGTMRQASQADVDAAYRAAEEAQPAWAALPPAERSALFRPGDRRGEAAVHHGEHLRHLLPDAGERLGGGLVGPRQSTQEPHVQVEGGGRIADVSGEDGHRTGRQGAHKVQGAPLDGRQVRGQCAAHDRLHALRHDDRVRGQGERGLDDLDLGGGGLDRCDGHPPHVQVHLRLPGQVNGRPVDLSAEHLERVASLFVGLVMLQSLSSAFTIMQFNPFMKKLIWGGMLLAVMLVNFVVARRSKARRRASDAQDGPPAPAAEPRLAEVGA